MKRSRAIWRWTMLVGAGALVAACKGPPERLKALLPPAPAGWSATTSTAEEIAGAGVRATGSYAPAGDQAGIDRIEVHYAVPDPAHKGERLPPMPVAPPPDTATEHHESAQFTSPYLKELRKHDGNQATMLKLHTIAGRPAAESVLPGSCHVATFRVDGDRVIVDVLALTAASPEWNDAKAAVLETFAKQLPFDKLEQLK